MDNKSGLTPWWLPSNATYRKRYDVKKINFPTSKQVTKNSIGENRLAERKIPDSCRKQEEKNSPEFGKNNKFDIWKERIVNLFYWICFIIIVFTVSILIDIPIIRILRKYHWERFGEELGLLSFLISLFIVAYMGSELIPNMIDKIKMKRIKKKH